VSHPGQYETYLNVKGKADLLDKIRKVWASTFNSRSLAFRLNKGMPLNNEPIGVAILAMVQARSAGIAFSADPNTGDLTKIIVEANWGLGESVVSGELMPDRWILEKESFKILDKTLGKKEKAVVSGVSGITEEELSKEKASAFSLSDEEVKGIGKFVVDLETLFGVPQDIEWAVSTEPSSPPIVLLQARPVVIAKKSTADQVIDMMVNLLTVS
jgi:pyruvate,water dikinase